MLTDFKFPYGHPAKTARMIERVGGEYGYAEFGDPKFIVIEPEWINKDPTMKFLWLEAMDGSERAYSTLRMNGASPQQARSVLPNSLKTEIVMTANLREWKHVFRMRCQKAAHPQIREIMLPLLKELHERIPVVFDEEYETFLSATQE
ncbi:MAG: FAD-dependent thymidylate synthase [Desulfobacteraceae bacterium]|nr:FAD-dependent thymidylate synthase [Desulfobacteraceae bacterium]